MSRSGSSIRGTLCTHFWPSFFPSYAKAATFLLDFVSQLEPGKEMQASDPKGKEESQAKVMEEREVLSSASIGKEPYISMIMFKFWIRSALLDWDQGLTCPASWLPFLIFNLKVLKCALVQSSELGSPWSEFSLFLYLKVSLGKAVHLSVPHPLVCNMVMMTLIHLTGCLC